MALSESAFTKSVSVLSPHKLWRGLQDLEHFHFGLKPPEFIRLMMNYRKDPGKKIRNRMWFISVGALQSDQKLDLA